MSVMGTGTAAAVAQTSQQGQQVARRQDRRRAEQAEESRRRREQDVAHIMAIEEGEEVQSPARPHIDQQLPDHHSQALEAAFRKHNLRRKQPEQSDRAPDEPSRHHVDVQA